MIFEIRLPFAVQRRDGWPPNQGVERPGYRSLVQCCESRRYTDCLADERGVLGVSIPLQRRRV